MTHEVNFDFSGALLEEHGLQQSDLEKFLPQLDAARREALQDVELLESGAAVPPEKEPLDAAFIRLPERLLAGYNRGEAGNELSLVLEEANRFAALVDRFVVVGIGGSYMGARALFEACCRPYYNEFDREARNGRPRIYFDGNNVDNDCLQSLLKLLESEAGWGIVAISKSGGTLEPAAVLRQLVSALRESCHHDTDALRERFIPITGPSGGLRSLASEFGCQHILSVPEGVGGRFSVFSAVGLLPAAIVGLDIVRLLQGAADMNSRFTSLDPLDNPVLAYTGVCHLLERDHGVACRVTSVWRNQLEALGLWYDQLHAESLGKQGVGSTPVTAVNTRDLHSRGQQHQDGKRDKLINNVVVDSSTTDPLPIGVVEPDYDGLNQYSALTIPDILSSAVSGTNTSYKDAQRPTTMISLPKLDEYAMGQLMQMLMLATVVEGKLLGIHPYGQPGVEGYKRGTRAALDELRKG